MALELLAGSGGGRQGWHCGYTSVKVKGRGRLQEVGSAVLAACLPACCLLFSFNCHVLKDFLLEGCLLAQARHSKLPAWALGVSAVHTTVREVELAGMSLGGAFQGSLDNPGDPHPRQELPPPPCTEPSDR